MNKLVKTIIDRAYAVSAYSTNNYGTCYGTYQIKTYLAKYRKMGIDIKFTYVNGNAHFPASEFKFELISGYSQTQARTAWAAIKAEGDIPTSEYSRREFMDTHVSKWGK